MYLKLFNDFYPPFRRSWSLALMMIRGSECQSGDYPGWNKRFYKWKLSSFSTNLFYWFPLAFCQLIIPRRIRIVTLLPPQQHNVTITVCVSAMCNPYTTKLGRISVTFTRVQHVRYSGVVHSRFRYRKGNKYQPIFQEYTDLWLSKSYIEVKYTLNNSFMGFFGLILFNYSFMYVNIYSKALSSVLFCFFFGDIVCYSKFVPTLHTHLR